MVENKEIHAAFHISIKMAPFWGKWIFVQYFTPKAFFKLFTHPVGLLGKKCKKCFWDKNSEKFHFTPKNAIFDNAIFQPSKMEIVFSDHFWSPGGIRVNPIF